MSHIKFKVHFGQARGLSLQLMGWGIGTDHQIAFLN